MKTNLIHWKDCSLLNLIEIKRTSITNIIFNGIFLYEINKKVISGFMNVQDAHFCKEGIDLMDQVIIFRDSENTLYYYLIPTTQYNDAAFKNNLFNKKYVSHII